jgi:hypothetical protein
LEIDGKKIDYQMRRQSRRAATLLARADEVVE